MKRNSNIRRVIFALTLFLGYIVAEESSKIHSLSSKIDLNTTIAEVEKILQNDPKLPRLSRTEIMDLIDNVTKTDAIAKQNKKNGQKDQKEQKDERQRAIMYVMPYSPKNISDANIQELYTKPPIVHMVGKDGESLIKPTQKPQVNIRFPATTKVPSNPNVSTQSPVIIQSQPAQKPAVVDKSQITFTTERPLAKVPENINIPGPYHEFPTSRPTQPVAIRPHGFRSPMRHPNHKYPEEPSQIYFTTTTRPTTPKPITQQAMRVIAAPTLSTKIENRPFVTNSRYSIQDQMSAPHPSVASLPEFKKIPPTQSTLNRRRPYPHRETISRPTTERTVLKPIPTQRTTTTAKSTTSTEKFDFSVFKDEIPHDDETDIDFGFDDPSYKELIKNLGSGKTDNLFNLAGKFSSQYNAFPVQKISKKQPQMRDNVKDILASIGLFPDSNIRKPTITTTTTTTTSKPDLSIGAESLDPEMRELLRTFGIIPNPNRDSDSIAAETRLLEDYDEEPTQPVVRPESYTGFKPLPSSNTPRQEMASFLAQFGLVDSQESKKSQKSALRKNDDIKILNGPPAYNEEMIPEDMKDLLSHIGLSEENRRRDRNRYQRIDRADIDNTSRKARKQHVFNPKNAHASNDELKKLELLLSTLKQLDKINGSISPSDIDSLDLANIKQLSESIANSTILVNTPLDEQSSDSLNPVSYEELQNLFPVKNDFKRQNDDKSKDDNNEKENETENGDSPISLSELENIFQVKPNDDSSISPSEELSEPGTTTTTTTEEPKNPPLSQLADSFPGVTDVESSPEVPDDALPPPRRNGFYFLLDWNSFLEVGEDGKNKVNIKFAPKIGDPSRFIAVKTP